MITSFGKFCRKLRIDSGELLKEMADKLAVTPSYLSAVENGKRNIPKTWSQLISQFYSLNSEQQQELMKAIEESQLAMKVEMKNYSSSEKNLIMAFARQIKELEEDSKLKIWDILSNDKKGGL
jgi:transcriptional regulator with XRE-family HTH domain